MSATRSRQPLSPTVADQLDDTKANIEDYMKAIQELLAKIQAQLDRLA